MKTYRIKEVSRGEWYKYYIIQRKSIFGFWYDINIGDRWSYSDIEKVRNEIRRRKTKEKIKYYEN